MHLKSLASLLLAASVAVAATSAYSAGNEQAAEAAALGTVKLSLTDAIAAVAAKDTGQVVEAMLSANGSMAVYEVTTLMADGTETTYTVDAQTGDVVAAPPAQQDQGTETGENGRENGEDSEGQNGETAD